MGKTGLPFPFSNRWAQVNGRKKIRKERNLMHKQALIYLTLMAFLLASCASAASSPETAADMYYDMEAPQEAPSAGMAGESDAGYNPANAFANASPDSERIVIKNADLSIIVDDPAASLDKISRMAEGMGGFVVSAQVYRQELDDGQEVLRASATIRVPAERLTEALEQIRAESSKPVMHENIDSQDVTREYTDLQSRLRNLEAAESQLQEIMLEANKTEDVLNVYNQLTQVREQIEVTKGQIQYYEQSAALSSITVQLVPDAAVQPLTIAGWEPVGVAKDAMQSLINGLKSLATIGIWAVLYALPMLLIVLAPVVLVVYAIRRLRQRSKTKSAPPTEPAQN